jgi:glycosyltransferase involved in cell wall biosynthesis
MGLLTDLVTVDTSMQIALKRFTRGIPVHIIHFGVSASMLSLARENPNQIRARIDSYLPKVLAQDKESVLLFFCGRIIERRMLEDLIFAFGKVCKVSGLRKTVLYIGGYTDTDSSYVKGLRTLAGECECESQIRFIGSLTSDELAYLYHNCDIFVFLAVQPWALAPLEAMAFGKPVIITDECGLAVILRSRDLASITRGRDPDELAKNIEYLVRDEDRRRSLGKSARTFVEENMTFNQTGSQLERAWQNS